MSTQQFKTNGGTGDDGSHETGQTQATPQTDTSHFDSMLDEIDGVLETNASEFVSGFVQKGGQ